MKKLVGGGLMKEVEEGKRGINGKEERLYFG